MPSASRSQRLLWFAGIWGASVAVTLLGAALLKWFFARVFAS
jgi:hypothetical protein